LFSSSSFAAQQYVSDNLTIYIHSGPSLEYRIIGTLKVGSSVNTLEYNEQTKFMHVKTETGRTGWVKVSELQRNPPAKVLLPKVQEQLKTAQEKLNTINSSHGKALSDKTQEISEKDKLIVQLQLDKQNLQKSVSALKALNVEQDILEETKESRVRMEWLMFGGSILFFGIIFGLIIPFLPRRKKNTNNW